MMKVSNRVYKTMQNEAKNAEERAVKARAVADEKKKNLANVEPETPVAAVVVAQ